MGASAAAQLDAKVIERVAGCWRDAVERGDIVGGVLLLAQDGELRYAGALG